MSRFGLLSLLLTGSAILAWEIALVVCFPGGFWR